MGAYREVVERKSKDERTEENTLEARDDDRTGEATAGNIGLHNTEATGHVFAIPWPDGLNERVSGGLVRRERAKQTEGREHSLCRLPGGGFEMLIKLGEMSQSYYLRNQQWREVFIAGPTLNSARNSGNDFPGFYYYDPARQYEWVVMVRGDVNWLSAKCTRHLRNGILEIGVVSRAGEPDSLQLEIWCDERRRMPTKWEALRTLIDRSLELLPLPEPDGPEPDWERMAQNCIKALNLTGLQRTCLGVNGFVAMVGDGMVPDFSEEPALELMCNGSIARSLLLMASIPGFEEAASLAAPLVRRVIPAFFHKDLGVFVNNLPAKTTPDGLANIVETWYLLGNLYNVLQIAACSRDERLLADTHISLQTVMGMVRALDYILPLYLDIGSCTEYGVLQNPSCLGIYAAICTMAAKVFPDDRRKLLEESLRALRVLRRLPIEVLHHETCQLSLAASAAHALFEISKDNEMLLWRDDFIRLLLMTMYRSEKHAGLFQACAGIMYPAFKENVEAVEAMATFVDTCDLPLRRVIELSLRNNLAYFTGVGCELALPLEAIGTREFPEADGAGTAVYAAGHVLDMARLQFQSHSTS